MVMIAQINQPLLMVDCLLEMPQYSSIWEGSTPEPVG